MLGLRVMATSDTMLATEEKRMGLVVISLPTHPAKRDVAVHITMRNTYSKTYKVARTTLARRLLQAFMTNHAIREITNSLLLRQTRNSMARPLPCLTLSGKMRMSYHWSKDK